MERETFLQLDFKINKQLAKTKNTIHAAVSSTQKMNCKFENIKTLRNVMNKMRHAQYSNRCGT